MPRKENTKAKTWERDRRSRMNGYFKNLSDLLPPHLEGRKRNKIDILIHASKYIKDLHSRTDDLFYARASDAHKEELARLKKLVVQLISRTQLLSDLLKDAGITVPAEPALEKISPLKWSNKINVVPGSQIAETVETTESGEKKKEKSTASLRANLKKKAVKVKSTKKQPVRKKCFPEKSKCTIEDQENHANSGSSDTNEKGDKSSSNEESALSTTSVEASSVKPEIKNHKKVKRKKKVSPKLKKTKGTTDVNSLAAGTYVLSGGKIVPMVTPMQCNMSPNIFVNAQTHPTNPIILNNAQQGQMIVVQPLQTNHFQTVSTMQTMNTVTLNTVPNIQTNMLINPKDWTKNVKTIVNSTKIGGTKGILPKIKEVTETTMTYKVPIPAIRKEKSDAKGESKGTSSVDKQTKGKNVSKAGKNSRLANTETQKDSQNSKDNNKNDDSKTKSPVNKPLKRNSNSNFNEIVETKKKKCSETENRVKNLQIESNVILNDTVTCKSIENLKQVISKIGENSSYSTVDNSTEKREEQKCNDNLINNSNTIALNNDKPREEKRDTENEFSMDEKAANLNNSNNSISSSEKELLNITKNMTDHSQQEDFSEKVAREPKSISEAKEIATENKDNETTETQKTEIQLASNCVIDDNIILTDDGNQTCTIETRLDNMLQSNAQNEILDEQQPENNKIFLNLDTNTTMKLEGSEEKMHSIPETSTSPSIKITTEGESLKSKNNIKEDQNLLKTISYSPSNSFVPINHKTDSLHSDLSNDIFASLQVPSSSNNSESISPTAAFLMAFPIVSSLTGKTEVLDDEMKDDFKYSSQTPPMLLQIGAIEPNNFKINTRSSGNDNLETAEPTGISESSQIKSTETITPISSSTSVAAPAKTLPRVVSSQTITESYKIIPVSSEQMNRQLNVETNSSMQLQQNNSTNSSENSNVNNTLTNRDQSSIIPDNIDRSMGNSIQNYPLENKSQSTFSYSKDMSLNSISSSMANEILNKYISTTSLATNTMPTETSSKYNSVSQYVAQECQTSVSNNCVKENVDRNSSQYSYPTDRDLCKLQICPMEAFTERSNEYSSRNNPPIETNNESLNKNIQIPINQEKISKAPIQNNQNVTSNNFHSIKKLESKAPPPTNTDTTALHQKKPNEIPNTNSYIGPCDNKISKKTMTVSSQPTTSVQKIAVSSRSSVFTQQTEASYIVTTNFEENNLTRSTTTVANTTSNFSILSWTTFSPLSSNNNFSQYEQTPVSTDISKNICENFNYLPLPKDNASLSNTLTQPTYSTVDSHMPNKSNFDNTFDKSKNNALAQPSYTTVVDPQMPNFDKSKNNTMAQPTYSTVDSQMPNFDKSKSSALTQPTYTTVDSQMSNFDKSKNNSLAQSSYTAVNAQMPSFDKPKNNTMTQPTYSTVDSHVPNFEKSKNNNLTQSSYTTVDSQMPNFDKSKNNALAQPSYTTVNSQIPSFDKSKNNTLTQPTYSTVDSQIPNFDKSKNNVLTQPSYTAVDSQMPNFDKSKNNALTQPTYSAAVDSQMPSFDKSKNKLPIDNPKRSYNDSLKSRTMRLSQLDSRNPSLQKSTRTHNQHSGSNSDYKFPPENKNKYKYPMDIDYMQNNYSSTLDLAPHLQHNQQQQNQQNQQTHQTSNSKTSNSSQQLQPLKTDKSNYMLPDYETHTSTNFNSDSANVQPRYSNGHEVYPSTTYKYASDNKPQQIHSKYQPAPQVPTSSLQPENALYNNNSNNTNGNNNNKQQHVQQQQQQQHQHQPQSKAKSEHAMRPPVNWMMTPEIKHNSNIGDIILPPIGKELDFCQNNIFSQTSGYNQTSGNHQFYNNYDMSTPTFPNIPVLQGADSKRNVDTTYYPEEQTFSWSPTKNLSQSTEQNQNLKSVETSTMPTLVGDLALGTPNVSDKQNFLFGQMPIRTSNTEIGKEPLKSKETNVSSREYQGIVNSQNPQQHSSHGMPFLSVSQLVDHEKVDKNQQQQQQTHNTVNHHHGSHHHPQHHQQPQQQQQPPSRKQRKTNSSPRASAKRQMDMRQKQSANSANDHIHRQHEEPKTSSSASGFGDTNYQQQQHQQQQQQQQQKYNQQSNDAQWRSRNCKSNYTAEALIGTNNTDSSSHPEKNLPKYTSSNYTQNKFSSSLSSDPMSINYFPNVDEAGTGYGQVMNQNFNHSYAYSSNANIYPTSNFITNSSANYMMSLHENTPDYLEGNNFLLPPNVSTTSITTPLLTNITDGVKSHHHHHHHHQPYKHQNCSDKRLYFSQQKKTKRKQETTSASSTTTSTVQNFDFPGLSSPLDDYHHTSTFLPPPNPLYQNQSYSKSTLPPPPPTVSSSNSGGNQVPGVPASTSNPMAMTQHHPSGTSLTNFNLSTIFPEINDKVTGYKSSTNGIAQPTSHTSTSYSQRSNYTDPMDQMSQASETTPHFNNSGSR